MDLASFLHYALIGAGVVVIFRNFDERTSQYLAVICVALSALVLFAGAGYIPFPSSWRVEVVFPAAEGILGLIILVRIAERSFALLIVALAALQVLIQTRVIQSLS